MINSNDEIQLLNKLIKTYGSLEVYYNKFSVKELIEIFELIKSKAMTEKGNWSVNVFEKNTKSITNQTLEKNLLAFYKVYSNRKKKEKKFYEFILRLNQRHSRKVKKNIQSIGGLYNLNSDKIPIKKNINYKEFLGDARDFKKNYLKLTDKQYIGFLKQHFEIDLKLSTLLKKYYSE